MPAVKLFMMYLNKYLTAICLLAFVFSDFSTGIKAQQSFYIIGKVQEININITQPDWRSTLDSLMKAGDNFTRITGEVEINGVRFKSAGIRFKGFSSWNYGAIKNPFNIELDYIITTRNYCGHKKLKLSNVIHDPSFLREVLSYYVARQYIPAPEANYARVYVNDTLIGLYSNVEDIDDIFMLKHFGSEKYTLIKGSPQKLIFPFGNNSNLSFISSSDSLAYEPYYQVISEYGWKELMNFIDVLNNKPESLETILNIDRTLWMHAFNYALLNLDSYIGYSQNYYLGMDKHGRFNTIPWDMNMSFGSFRSSDASYNFQGLSIDQIKKLDPLQHLTFSISPRPLMTNLFKDPTLQKMYLAHLRTIINEQFESGILMDIADSLHAIIDSFVYNDTNRFYSYNDFLKNIDTTVGGSGNMILYVGLRELISERAEYLKSYPGFNANPEIMQTWYNPEIPKHGDYLYLNARVEYADEVWLYYRHSSEDLFTKVLMFDDGMNNDSLPGDGIWGVKTSIEGDIFHYYLFAQNDSAGIFSPERAANRYFAIYPRIQKGKLAINEINRARLSPADAQTSQTEQWIEIFNNSLDTICLKGMYLAYGKDNPEKWNMPDTLLPPHSFFLIFPDGLDKLPVHCSFILSESSGLLQLGYSGGYLIDSIGYFNLVGNNTYGRYPNGFGSFFLMPATFSRRNVIGGASRHALNVYPNPAKDRIWVEYIASGPLTFRIYSYDGRLVNELYIDGVMGNEKAISAEIDISGFTPGVYLIQIINGNDYYSEKVIVYE